MSKSKTPKKKVVTTQSKVSTNGKKSAGSKKRKISPTVSRSKSGAAAKTTEAFIFGRENYLWMAIGAGVILLGLLLMIGGHMPDADTWDENRIYGFRNTVLAPFVILLGLGIEVYAIFKK